MLTIQLSTMHMMAESLNINQGGATINSSSDILVKEQNTPSDVNLWNDEW